MTALVDNVARIRERMARALERSGRPGPATLVAVTKTFGADVVREVIRAGVADVGENRVQELVSKAAEIDLPCRWHLVGPLQRNKAAKAIGVAHLMHAIDGVRIAQTVDRIAGERGVRARVLLEVNTSGEASKHGVTREEAPAVVEAMAGMPHLELRGLMTLGPASADPTRTRECFRSLAALARDLRARSGLDLPELSMGMSADFEAAIEEGATIIRLGRALMGDRPAVSRPGG